MVLRFNMDVIGTNDSNEGIKEDLLIKERSVPGDEFNRLCAIINE
ncbi:MAG: hypothetical protein WDN26_19260 [Chitinophagaceae bacterium]